MVWYSHLFKNFPQFVVIDTVKGFNVVNEREIDVFLEFLCFQYDATNVGNFISDISVVVVVVVVVVFANSFAKTTHWL